MDSSQIFITDIPAIGQLYVGSYNMGLVALSIVIAVVVSYTALVVVQLARRVDNAKRGHFLLTLGGATLGLGVWSMHFIGMLGFAIPCGITYNPYTTALSMLPGVLAGIFSLHLISKNSDSWSSLLIGGVLFGGGIGVMHYWGMAAMQMEAFLRYDLKLFLLSIVVAVVLAVISLWVRFGIVKLLPAIENYAIFISSLVMGSAVSGMHYTAMEAAYFLKGDVSNIPASGFDPTNLAIAITGVTGLIVGVVLLVVYSQFTRQIAGINEKLQNANNILKFQKIALDHHAIVSIADVEGNITYVNDKFVDSIGYSRDELLGKNHRVIKSQEHSEKFYNNLWQTITQGEIWQGEIKNRAKNGKEMWMHSTIVPFIDEQTKRPYQYISISTDVTGIKEVEDALARMSKVFQDASDPMIIEDLNGKITDMNREAQRAYGWTKEELIGQSIKTFVPENRYEQVAKLQSLCLSGKEVRGVEAAFLTKGGKQIDVLLTLSLLRSDSGEPMGIATYAVDFSARKQAEDALQEKYQDLARFRKLAIGRELQMIELKKEVNHHLQQQGLQDRYKIVAGKKSDSTTT
ncbi:MAG: PAS domain S-box protein [Magnetococcales bacterium]|nr:PAS domain S-box protein [Magnetococcales bacterium]